MTDYVRKIKRRQEIEFKKSCKKIVESFFGLKSAEIEKGAFFISKD